MISAKSRYRISFCTLPEPVSDIWRTIVACLESAKSLPENFYVSQIAGHSEKYHSEERLVLSPSQISELIEARKLNGFSCNTGYSKRSVYFSLRQFKKSGSGALLESRIEISAKAPADWGRLIEAILNQWPGIMGYQWNHQYIGWQEYCIEEGYEQIFGTIPPGVKRYLEKSTCSLSPDQKMIDISMNPGRFMEILPGIRFHPTAEMWLGPQFWQFAKCTKDEVLSADFFLEKRDTPHFLYLKSWPRPFTRPDGEQGRQQQRIWELFFHEDCEWPPGNGGISEEPMYGPPHLIPKESH